MLDRQDDRAGWTRAASLSGNEWNFGTDRATERPARDARSSSISTPSTPSSPSGGWLALIVPDANTSRSPSGFITLYLIKSVDLDQPLRLRA